jgi:hypothetical protein
MQQLGLIHTVSSLAPTFAGLAAELLTGVELTVVADETLLKDTVRRGAVSEATTDRLRGHVDALHAFGVDAVLVTCSSIGRQVDSIAASAKLPVHRVDRPMAERAVALGATVGVLATLPTTLGPTADLVQRCAHERGREVEVVSHLCADAFAALERGESERYQAILIEELDVLSEIVDVVVLAQASMAQIAADRPDDGTPVLSSPRLAMEQLAQVVAQTA